MYGGGCYSGSPVSRACVACDDSCFGVGFDLCYGLPVPANNNDPSCCNFYDNDVCVAECPPHTLPDRNNDCVRESDET